MRDVCGDFGGEMAEFDGGEQPLHLMVNFPPTVILSRRVNNLVGVSSWRPQREFLDLTRHNWSAKPLWSWSYFPESAAAPISVLRQYINQEDRYSCFTRFFPAATL
jgi:putative transposase